MMRIQAIAGTGIVRQAAILPVLAGLFMAGCYRPVNKPPERPIAQQIALPTAQTKRIDDVTVHQFPNGFTLIHKENTTNAIVGMVLWVQAGAAREERDKSGATNLMMRVLPKGTRTRTADQIAEELGQLGASLAPSAGQDYIKLSLQCVNEDFRSAMDLFADVALNPVFPVDEVDLERRKVLAQIRMGEDQSGVVATKRFLAEAFGSHPYARPVEGTPITLPSITAPDLAALHESAMTPANMVLSIVGNISFEDARAQAERYFGTRMVELRQTFEANKIITPGASRSEIAKDVEQGFIVMGNRTCPAGHEDEPALEVATAILGGGMSSRLFVELRDKQGLAYAVGASSSFMRHNGYFLTYIGTGPKTIDHSVDGLWAEVRRLRDEPVEAEELERAKNYIAGQYLRNHERNMQQASYLGYWHLSGRGVDYDRRYLEAIRTVTTRDVMKVANKYFLEPTVVIVRPTGEKQAE